MRFIHATLLATVSAFALSFSCFVSATSETRYVSIGQLLEKADSGDHDAVLMLAAADKFVFPDGSLASQIRITPELTELMKQLTVRQSLYLIAQYADGGFFESDPDAWKSNKRPDPITTCEWITRAANYPLEGSDTDKILAAETREIANEIAQHLGDDGRATCLKSGKNWSLKRMLKNQIKE